MQTELAQERVTSATVVSARICCPDFRQGEWCPLLAAPKGGEAFKDVP